MADKDEIEVTEEIQDEGHLGKYFHMMLNMDDDDLNPYQYRLLGHYRRVCGRGGKCTQGVRKIAEITQMSTGQVSVTRRELAEMGYIIVTERNTKNGESLIVRIKDRMLENIQRYTRSGDEHPCSCGEHPCSCGENPCSCGKQTRSGGERKNNPSKNNPSKKIDSSLPDEPASKEFTAAKFYLVSDVHRQIFIKPYTKKAAESEAARLSNFGVKVVKGADLNAAADTYRGYTRKAPERPPQVALEAICKAGWNVEKKQLGVLTGEDWTKINAILDAVALAHEKTRNQIVNDATIAAQIHFVYEQYKKANPTLSAPKSPAVFIGAWNEHASKYTPPAPPQPAGEKRQYQAPVRNGAKPT